MRSDPTERDLTHWTLDKRLNVGHILTTLALAGSIITWGSVMERRVAVLEDRSVTQEKRDAGQDVAASNAVLLLRADLAGMRAEAQETNRKLDRLIESMMAREQRR